MNVLNPTPVSNDDYSYENVINLNNYLKIMSSDFIKRMINPKKTGFQLRYRFAIPKVRVENSGTQFEALVESVQKEILEKLLKEIKSRKFDFISFLILEVRPTIKINNEVFVQNYVNYCIDVFDKVASASD